MIMIDGNESHTLLMIALRVIDDWTLKLSTSGFINHERHFKVNFILKGEMKFIQLVKGLQSATSMFSCPLCLKPKQMKLNATGTRDSEGFRIRRSE